MRDLFGEVPPAQAQAEEVKALRKPRYAGYAAMPGTGPQEHTCGDCKHKTCSEGSNRNYLKCLLRKSSWTHGFGTDILARSPACAKWEPKT